jgi:hypothetical protein
MAPFTFCPQGVKGKEPNTLMRFCGGVTTVYWNKEFDQPVEIAIACIVQSCLGLPCIYPGFVWVPDTTNGKIGDTMGCLPTNPGHDPGCLCKCGEPCCAFLMHDPDNTTGCVLACILQICGMSTAACCGVPCYLGSYYALISKYEPKPGQAAAPAAPAATGAPAAQNVGVPDQQDMA